MHKWAKEILECVKTKVEAIGVDSFEGQNLDDLKDWTEIAKNIACFDKDYRIVEAMEKAEDEEEIMEMLERYEDYPERRYYNHYHYKNGRFAPKGSGVRRGYEEPYYHMTPEMYRDHDAEWYRDIDRKSKNVMYYTEPAKDNESRYERAKRMYTETKDVHKANTPEDKTAKLKDLEAYMKSIAEDITEVIDGVTPEERAMIKNKLTVMAQKIG